MRRRNWSVIFSLAAIAGYAGFGFWGAFVAPMVALAAYAWNDRREGSAAQTDEEERFAAFLQSADAAPEIPETPIAPVQAREMPRLSRAALATRSIASAVRSTDMALAAGLFEEFSALRDQLTLDAGTLDKLGQTLLERRAYLDAGWALHAGAIAAGDAVAAEKKLAEVAGKAAVSGQLETARRLYLELVERYPEAGFANFARARAEELQRQAQTSS